MSINLFERVACTRKNACNVCFVAVSSIYIQFYFSLALLLSLSRARALSVPAECQKLAWKAGHKRECVTGAAGAGAVGSQALGRALGMRQDTVARWTAKEKRLWEKMKDLDAKQDWRGLAALENEARTAATQAPTDLACEIYNRLGCCYFRMGQYGKAITMHKEGKKIAEEVAEIQSAGFHDMSGAPFVAVSTKESIEI